MSMNRYFWALPRFVRKYLNENHEGLHILVPILNLHVATAVEPNRRFFLFLVTCSNVLRSRSLEGCTLKAFLRQGRNIISYFTQSVTCFWSIAVTSYVYCAVSVPLYNSTSHHKSLKSVVFHKISCMFSPEMFIVCKAFDLVLKNIRFERAIRQHIDQRRWNASVSLFHSSQRKILKIKLDRSTSFNIPSFSSSIIVGGSAAGQGEPSYWQTTSLGSPSRPVDWLP